MKKPYNSWTYRFDGREYKLEYDTFGYQGTTYKAARRHAGNRNLKSRWGREKLDAK